MSTKVTEKTIKDYAMATSKPILKVGYCNLQHLLKYSNVYGHTERAEGCGCDIYILPDAIITTGYAPFGEIQANYKTCEKYETKALQVINKYNFYSNELVNELEKLQNEFVNEVLKK